MKELNHKIFWPPFVLLMLSLALSIFFPSQFLDSVNHLNASILKNFDWLFSWATFLIVVSIVICYFSPIAKITIGGKNAEPILNKWKWFSICLCTTIATGILFWGSAEPIYHLNGIPSDLGIKNRTESAVQFAMSTMFMHWTITPYAIYTLAALLFALSFYNLNQKFSIAALLYPISNKIKTDRYSNLLNAICLFALVAGMSASLGTGILTISGGLNYIFEVEQNNFLLLLITIAIVISFCISASTGLLKGIKLLSNINFIAFVLLAFFVLIFSPLQSIIEIAWQGFTEFLATFFQRSTNIKSSINTDWQQSWTIFYWANWLAWTPVTALFLGRISKGYTVRQFINFNLFLPALFSGMWMCIFSGTALSFDTVEFPNALTNALNTNGPQNVIYTIFDQLPFSLVIIPIFLLIVFISFVTAADSNTNALGSICSKSTTNTNVEGSTFIKLLWGIIIGAVAYIMIASAGIDGIKTLSTIGGFPILFFMIFVMISLYYLMFDEKIRAELKE